MAKTATKKEMKPKASSAKKAQVKPIALKKTQVAAPTKSKPTAKKAVVTKPVSKKTVKPAQKAQFSAFDMKGFDKQTIIAWYKMQHLGRRLDEKAALYLKMAKGWSYHAIYCELLVFLCHYKLFLNYKHILTKYGYQLIHIT